MRIAVTGRNGQVATALLEQAARRDIEMAIAGRPVIDLGDPALATPAGIESLTQALGALEPDAIVNAAAYTAVDQAESEEAAAFAVNATGAGAVAAAARTLGVPVIHLSTDYVFDGALDRPYREDDAVGPISAYGRSKLAGEQAVAAATPNHAIVRTAWVYSPFGKNFVRTMLRLGAEREEVNVVADQFGSPTAAHDIAEAVLTMAEHLVAAPTDASLRGAFHLTGRGEASWAAFAQAIFDEAERHGRRPVRVRPIPTSAYPTPARRPANSRLDGGKLSRVYGIVPPPWHESLAACVARLLTKEELRAVS